MVKRLSQLSTILNLNSGHRCILFSFFFFFLFYLITSNTFSLHSIVNIFLLILSFLQGDKLYPMLGLSCFAYLLLVEEMEDMNFPAVFRYNL